VKPDCACLGSGNRLPFFDGLQVPACSHGNRYRKNRPQSVDDIKPKQQRNTKTRLLDRYMLQPVQFRRISHDQDRTDTTCCNFISDRDVIRSEREKLAQLPCFFLGRHLRQQRVHPFPYHLVIHQLGRPIFRLWASENPAYPSTRYIDRASAWWLFPPYPS
jgi:hypothetical protein